MGDLEVLLKKIRVTARQEGKATTALGLGRFFMKLATGNPISAAIDAVITRQTALTVGDRLNTLMEMELLVSNLEQFVRGRLANAPRQDGKLVLDTAKFVEANKDDLLALMALGAHPAVLARLLGVEEKDLEPLRALNVGRLVCLEPETGATGTTAERVAKATAKRRGQSKDLEEETAGFLELEMPAMDLSDDLEASGEGGGSEGASRGHEDDDEDFNDEDDDDEFREAAGEKGRGDTSRRRGPKRVQDLVIFDVEDSGEGEVLDRAFVESERRRLLKSYGAELQELYDKRVSPETVAKIFGIGKQVVTAVFEYFRT